MPTNEQPLPPFPSELINDIFGEAVGSMLNQMKQRRTQGGDVVGETIDGVPIITGDGVEFIDPEPRENGIYTVSKVGSVIGSVTDLPGVGPTSFKIKMPISDKVWKAGAYPLPEVAEGEKP